MGAARGMREALAAAGAPVIAVTPLVAGKGGRGPPAKIMTELGLEPSPLNVARHYEGVIDGFLLDCRDADLQSSLPCRAAVADTLMLSLDDKQRVARAGLGFAGALHRCRQ